MIKMHETKMVPLGELQPAEYNPREMGDEAMHALCNSLAEYGFVEPVVVRPEDGLVIGGHQRLTAMQLVLMEGRVADDGTVLVEQHTEEEAKAVEVPVIYIAGISDDQAKVLNIALNRIHGDWDYDKLRDVFDSISFDDVDVTLSGFSLPEIGDLGVLLGDLTMPGAGSGEGGSMDPDAVLAAEARKFSFQVGSDEQADTCRAALRAYGMTGPRNEGAAFAAAMRAALTAKEESDDGDSDAEV